MSLLVSEGAEFTAGIVVAAGHEPSIASVGDYMALMKPRVMSLVVFTALVGLVIAPGHMHPVIAFTALLCIAVGAGAAGALEQQLQRLVRHPVRSGSAPNPHHPLLGTNAH